MFDGEKKKKHRRQRKEGVIQGLVSRDVFPPSPIRSKAYANVILTLFWFTFPFPTTPIKSNLICTHSYLQFQLNPSISPNKLKKKRKL